MGTNYIDNGINTRTWEQNYQCKNRNNLNNNGWGNKTYGCMNTPIVGRTKTYGIGNQQLWLWEQNDGCGNKNLLLCELKPMIVGTLTYGCRNKIFG
jgi:hypothetical protein